MTTLNLEIDYRELGFVEPPFRLTPDTDFFFPGSRHLEGLRPLRLEIASGAFIM